MYKSTMEVDVDGFHPKVPMDYPDEYCKEHLDILYKVEMAHLANRCEYLPPSFTFRRALLGTGLLPRFLP